MDDGVAPVRRAQRDRRVGEVAAHGADAERAQLRVVAARHAHDLVAAGEQPAHDRSAEEAAAAGDQHPHGCPSAHAPSAGRSILELCRMSTGKSSR